MLPKVFARKTFAFRKAAHIRLGRRGENLAARLLEELGLEPLVRNYRCAHGEIDLIVRDGNTLCFVEVKTRRRANRSRPADAVNWRKRKRLVRTAQRYLREIGHARILYRFDIVEIIFTGRQVSDARYWHGAFTEDKTRMTPRSPFTQV